MRQGCTLQELWTRGAQDLVAGTCVSNRPQRRSDDLGHPACPGEPGLPVEMPSKWLDAWVWRSG